MKIRFKVTCLTLNQGLVTFSVLIQDKESTVLSLYVPATKFVSVPVTPSSAPGAYHDDAAKGEEVSSLRGRR